MAHTTHARQVDPEEEKREDLDKNEEHVSDTRGRERSGEEHLLSLDDDQLLGCFKVVVSI